MKRTPLPPDHRFSKLALGSAAALWVPLLIWWEPLWRAWKDPAGTEMEALRTAALHFGWIPALGLIGLLLSFRRGGNLSLISTPAAVVLLIAAVALALVR